MKVFKQIFNFYINSSVHVALSVLSLTWITLLDLHNNLDASLLFFVFFATITGYNFVKYFGVAKFHHRSLTTRLKAIQIFSFFCFVMMCYFSLFLGGKTLYFIGGFGLITFLYAIPFLPKRYFIDQQHNLRSVVGLKIYLIALVWTGVTVFLPVIEYNFSINQTIVLLALQRFLIVIVLMLPFEIRDLQYDSLRLSTLPQQIGVRFTKLLGIVLLVVILFLDYIIEYEGVPVLWLILRLFEIY